MYFVRYALPQSEAGMKMKTEIKMEMEMEMEMEMMEMPGGWDKVKAELGRGDGSEDGL